MLQHVGALSSPDDYYQVVSVCRCTECYEEQKEQSPIEVVVKTMPGEAGPQPS